MQIIGVVLVAASSVLSLHFRADIAISEALSTLLASYMKEDWTACIGSQAVLPPSSMSLQQAKARKRKVLEQQELAKRSSSMGMLDGIHHAIKPSDLQPVAAQTRQAGPRRFEDGCCAFGAGAHNLSPRSCFSGPRSLGRWHCGKLRICHRQFQ